MTRPTATTRLLCNGSTEARGRKSGRAFRLDYRPEAKAVRNMNVSLPAFESRVLAISDRILDLLEIAAYVFCADRCIRRGARDDVEYHTWSRTLEFRIRVRDAVFWRRTEVLETLGDVLRFMSGDRRYEFHFEPGHTTPPSTLFSQAGTVLRPAGPVAVSLFSGGLDSLAGAVERLDAGDHVCLVSHRSQPGTIHTQTQLATALQRLFPGHVTPYGFDCTLRGIAAPEETQRTRAFLYTSIGFAVSATFGESRLHVFENGVTSVNFRRREDQGLARTSRTTHPKTMRLLERLFSLIRDATFTIEQPFLAHTKPDILRKLSHAPIRSLVDSTVSCSQTRKNLGMAMQCGTCFQCVDRRMAAFAADLDEVDHPGLYACDFLTEPLAGQAKTTFVDYLRQALDFRRVNIDHFYEQHLPELADVTDGMPHATEAQVVERMHSLVRRHGDGIASAIRTIVAKHDDPSKARVPGSALDLIAQQEHLKAPVERLVATILARVEPAIQHMFAKGRLPADENDFNQKLAAAIGAFRSDLASEHPTVNFACAGFTPDHAFLDAADLLIESKYVRGSTTPGKIRDPISADLTNTPPGKHLLVLVFDPESAISDRRRFQTDFESRGNCTVRVVR